MGGVLRQGEVESEEMLGREPTRSFSSFSLFVACKQYGTTQQAIYRER